MVNFVCMNCGYRFQQDKKKSCPYCNGNSVEKEKSVEELMDEVELE